MFPIFVMAGIGGLLLLIILPYDKNRYKRLAMRGGAATLFGVGLIGSVFTIVSP